MPAASRIAACLLIVLGGRASATSFDCSKANAAPEKIVCSDASLGALDDQLARSYKQRLTQSRSAESERRSQIRWLVEVRDKCASVDCMRSAYRARLSALQPPASAARACAVREADLLGSWVRRSGPAFFEEMAFGADGTKKEFDSWLHHRPEFSGGSWSLKECTIYIKHPVAADLAFEFKVIAYRNGRLQIAENGEGGESIYRKIGK